MDSQLFDSPLRALAHGRPRTWIALGVVLGLGLLNKTSMLWFCGAALPDVPHDASKPLAFSSAARLAARSSYPLQTGQ